jgi:hypothetical protein
VKIIQTAGVIAGVALLTGACGSSSPPSSTASSQSPSRQNAVQQAFKYAACMRNHGATNFPDPQVTTTGNSQKIAIRAIGPNNPQFKGALKACQGILPMPSKADLAAQAAQRRTHTQDLLSFARCMRGRGISDFPDPDAQGDLTTEMITTAGVDLHAPQTAAAARACIPAAHGILTPAMVAQATGSSG